MKDLLRLSTIAVCGAVLWAAVALPARAEFKCDGRQLSRVDASACAHAAQGPGSLQRFVHTHAKDLRTADARLRALCW